MKRALSTVFSILILVTPAPTLAQVDPSDYADEEVRLDLTIDRPGRLDRIDIDRSLRRFGSGSSSRALTDPLGLRDRSLRPFRSYEEERPLDPLSRDLGTDLDRDRGIGLDTGRRVAPDRLRMEEYGTSSELYR